LIASEDAVVGRRKREILLSLQIVVF